MADAFKENGFLLQNLTQKYVEELTEIWRRIFDTNQCHENLIKLFEHANDFYGGLVKESKEREEEVRGEITQQLMEAEKLKRLLKIDFDQKVKDNVPLLVMQAQLDNSLAEMRECLRLRKEQIYELLLEQESLCEELGEPPRPLLADPLPTEVEIQEFRQHLEKLKQERVERLHKVSTLRREIKNYLNILEMEVPTETEDRLLNHRQIKLNKETFVGLNRLRDCYGKQMKEMREKIEDTKSKVEALWVRLDTSPTTRNKFKRYTEYTQKTYLAFYEEMNRCQQLKSQNIKLYVNQIRQEIVDWWNKTLKSEVQRNRFSNFYSNCYTDDLLVLHEMELEDLKQYYENNKEIFELFADRKVLWERMTALEAKASEPGRYNNRGGQLLKEEKERKLIASKLPKIEQQIMDLVQAYEEREHKSFLVNGENIIDVMSKEWSKKREAKEQISSARKHGQTPLSKSQLTTTTATRTPMSARNISAAASSANRKTPGTAGTASKANAALSLAKKRKLNHAEHITPMAKRSLIYTTNSPNLFLKPTNIAGNNRSKSPQKRVLATTIRRRSGRLSSSASKKRRSKAKAAAVAAAALKPQIVITDPRGDNQHDDTYGSFEKCIEPASRSSLIPNESNTLSITRGSKPKRYDNSTASLTQSLSPRKQPRTPNSPSIISNSGRKLTTKNLPILI